MLSTTWPLFRAFRVDVRISWTIVVVPLFLWYLLAKGPQGLPAQDALAWAVVWTAGLYACVWTHEMGHIVMGRRCGVDTRDMTLRALGGLAHLDAPAPTPKAEIAISLAGPVTHLGWMAVLYPILWIAEWSGADMGSQWYGMLYGFAGFQTALMVFNLLPFYPLDGGRVLRGVLSMRMHSQKASLWTANVGFGGAVALGLTGLGLSMPGLVWLGVDRWGFMLVWIAIEGWMSCRRLQMQVRSSGAAYEPVEQCARRPGISVASCSSGWTNSSTASTRSAGSTTSRRPSVASWNRRARC